MTSKTATKAPALMALPRSRAARLTMAALALGLFGGISAAQATAVPTATASTATAQLPIRVAALPADHFAQGIEIKDDQLEPYVSFSSRKAHKSRHALGTGTEGNLHLTAHLDRNTNTASYRVWQDITNTDAPRELTRVHYRAGGKVTQANLSVANHWDSNCVPKETGGQCDQRIRVAFDLPEHVVREIAEGHQQGSRQGWAFRYKDAQGSDLDSVLAPAEAAGLIRTVDAWRANRVG
ncbi:hypothetical protein [Novosphingobium terrae]|uniref:hypothetical protein n=1 Tax=Novosphingobium terrae TaxID=2726189 RepID=UPI00197FC9DC|nr:hypothetical protein [Novosphingobium terrae]